VILATKILVFTRHSNVPSLPLSIITITYNLALPTSMSSPKERHYWAQLRAALTAGRWRASHPAKAPNGTTALPWPELLRKFNKHCPGYRDISELAALTQALALLLSARYEDDDEDIEVSMPAVEQQGSDAEVASQRGELDIDGECVLLEERIEEALVGYELLKSLGPTSFDVRISPHF
jgi:hypothetical protein